MLEKLGKSEKTQDELFDEYVNNITKQQVKWRFLSFLFFLPSAMPCLYVLLLNLNAFFPFFFVQNNALRLQKEVKNYVAAVKCKLLAVLYYDLVLSSLCNNSPPFIKFSYNSFSAFKLCHLDTLYSSNQTSFLLPFPYSDGAGQ